MNTIENIKLELKKLLKEKGDLISLLTSYDDQLKFGTKYQIWYSKAIKIVTVLSPERLKEFNEYYLIDPRRKAMVAQNYVIQDYIKGIVANKNSYNKSLFEDKEIIQIRVFNQYQILNSLNDRIDSVLQDITGHLLSEIQDKELDTAKHLLKISPRAAGSLAGVILEKHLQNVAATHQITIKKKYSTISDLNDPLKNNDIYDHPTWRKIQFLADLRNLCSHQKDTEPTKEQVNELITGIDTITKNIY